MGIYVFNARLLEKLLIADATDDKSAHDFGKNVIPGGDRPAAGGRLSVHRRQDARAELLARRGHVDAYYDANIELVHVEPELNLYDEEWPIWTYQVHQPPAKFMLDEVGRRGMAVNSMVSGG